MSLPTYRLETNSGHRIEGLATLADAQKMAEMLHRTSNAYVELVEESSGKVVFSVGERNVVR